MSKLKVFLGVGAIASVLILSGGVIAAQSQDATSVDDYPAWKEVAYSDSCMNADAS